MQQRYPAATWRPLGPQTEPSIGTPRVLVVHTMVGRLESTDAMFRQQGYSGVESTFGLGGPWDGEALDGAVWQWQDLGRQADAQMAGNAYATSIETSDGGDPDRPWSTHQLAALIDLAEWWCKTTGNPARLVAHPGDRGIGYHSQFPEWAGGHSCPNPIRKAQLLDLVIPSTAKRLGTTPATLWTILSRVLRLADPRMTGDDVRAVQARVGTSTDGEYGPLTESAVIRWQSRHGVDADGVVGPATAASMGFRWAG
jgi:hypothetical protein